MNSQQLINDVNAAKEKVKKENNNNLKAKTASCKRALIDSAGNNWQRKTENLNLDKDVSKIWELVRAMNDKNRSVAPIVLKQNDKVLTGKQAESPREKL